MKAWSFPKISSVAPPLFPKGLEADAYRFTGMVYFNAAVLSRGCDQSLALLQRTFRRLMGSNSLSVKM
jgi:hypothetical protein